MKSPTTITNDIVIGLLVAKMLKLANIVSRAVSIQKIRKHLNFSNKSINWIWRMTGQVHAIAKQLDQITSNYWPNYKSQNKISWNDKKKSFQVFQYIDQIATVYFSHKTINKIYIWRRRNRNITYGARIEKARA